MKTKPIISFLGLGILFLTMVMMGGCGESVSESKTYYSPNWTPDGRIIAYKEVITTRKTWGWENPIADYKTYITTISSDGANEVDLFEIHGFGQEIVCAPDGNKIGYVTSGSRYLAICNYDGTGNSTIEGVSEVKYFDWSPDSTNIAYSNASRELHIVNIDGTNNTQIATSAEAVAWRVGEVISYENIDGVYIFISKIKPDGSSYLRLTSALYPQNRNDSKILFRSGTSTKNISVIDPTGSNEAVLFDNYEATNVKLSFDNTKIVGGDLDQQDIVGIWVVNIDGTGAKRLR